MQKADVNSPAGEYTASQLRWQRVNALLGGTDTMRAAGETFLPKFEKESKKSYERRLATSVLFGGFETTLSTMVGMPFAKPISVGEDVPARLRLLTEDIDQAGNRLEVFAKERFRGGLAKGSDHIFVDMDAATPETAADDLIRRPRWVPVSAEQLIDLRTGMVEGRERPVHVRYRETVTEWEGYAEKRIDQVREITPAGWRVWRKGKTDWEVFAEGPYGMPFVTLAPFLAGTRLGRFTARSPLENIAHLNVTHWQSASDQRNILTVSRFAMLFLKNAASKDLEIGPFTAISGEGEHADAKFVEHQGHAIGAGERDLEKLERLMEAEGVRMLTRRPGTVTATENAIDEAKDQSELQSIAADFADVIELAAEYTARWYGEASGGAFTLNGDYGYVGNAQAIKETVLELRRMGDLSAEDAMRELQRARLLSDSLDIEEAVERAGEDVARTLGLGARQVPQDPPSAD